MKAAYLYNFGRFVEWPPRTGEAQARSFTICVVGQDHFGAALNNTLADETIAGKSVAIKRIQTAPGSNELPNSIHQCVGGKPAEADPGSAERIECSHRQ